MKPWTLPWAQSRAHALAAPAAPGAPGVMGLKLYDKWLQQASSQPPAPSEPFEAKGAEEVEAVDEASLSTEELELLKLLPQESVRGKVGEPCRSRFVYIYINGCGNQARRLGLPAALLIQAPNG